MFTYKRFIVELIEPPQTVGEAIHKLFFIFLCVFGITYTGCISENWIHGGIFNQKHMYIFILVLSALGDPTTYSLITHTIILLILILFPGIRTDEMGL